MTRFAVRAAVMAAGLAGVAPLGGCTQPLMVNGCPAVPAVQAESVPAPPPTGEVLIWQPGAWNYVNGQFVWEPGHYVVADPGRRAWVGGGFAPGPGIGACNWVPAHWVS